MKHLRVATSTLSSTPLNYVASKEILAAVAGPSSSQQFSSIIKNDSMAWRLLNRPNRLVLLTRAPKAAVYGLLPRTAIGSIAPAFVISPSSRGVFSVGTVILMGQSSSSLLIGDAKR